MLTAGADEAVEVGTGSGSRPRFSPTACTSARPQVKPCRTGGCGHMTSSRSSGSTKVGRSGTLRARFCPSPYSHTLSQLSQPRRRYRQRHVADSIRFLFLDANHSHPWPALDLLALLEVLGAGATVVLHDVNLPRIHPEFSEWGVNHVFEDLKVEKVVPDVELPNIGAFVVPNAKEQVRDQLIGIVQSHPWEEVDVPDDFVKRVLEATQHLSG